MSGFNPRASMDVKLEDIREAEERSEVGPMYKRPTRDRVFVNRTIRLDKIKYIGFDMDYTLAVYKSPAYEQLSYNLALRKLVDMGYPEQLLEELSYDPRFATRGLFVDTNLGNLLKVDGFGYIETVRHGTALLDDVSEHYPSMILPPADVGRRYFPLNTLFNLVDACLFAHLVDWMEVRQAASASGAEGDAAAAAGSSDGPLAHSLTNLGVMDSTPGVMDCPVCPGWEVSYTNLFNDVRSAVDLVHGNGDLKNATMADFDTYVEKTGEQMATLLHRLRSRGGKKTFLLTNSGYRYTEHLMTWLLNGVRDDMPNWKDYFDYIVVGAKKPSFFGEGTTLREVDQETGALRISNILRFERGHVYNGGSQALFSELTGAAGSEVLYVGDHIFSDVIVSKKMHGWRNLLVVRELSNEIKAWAEITPIHRRLWKLESLFAETYRGLDSDAEIPPDVNALRQRIEDTIQELNDAFNPFFGSLFKASAKPSFFAMQVQRYADLYTADYLNLLNYPHFYYFSAIPNSMPHETQVVDTLGFNHLSFSSVESFAAPDAEDSG